MIVTGRARDDCSPYHDFVLPTLKIGQEMIVFLSMISLLLSYRKGKRSALVDHQTKNREHKQLVESMETSLKRVMLVAGVAQRLLGKVAIVTGTALAPFCVSGM